MADKYYTWEYFETTWGKQFRDVVAVLKMINLYPERLHLVYLGNIILPKKLESFQKDWIKLYNKFNNIEKEYYQPYFVPINSDDYKLFIDLSKKGYPMIQPLYDERKEEWFHMTRFESLVELIEFLDSDSNEPPVCDKDFAAQIDAKIAELDLDEIIRKYQKYKKDHPF